MSKVSSKRRQFRIRAKRKRKQKIKNLKAKYIEAKNKQDKEEIFKKIKKIAPHYPDKEILKLAKEK